MFKVFHLKYLIILFAALTIFQLIFSDSVAWTRNLIIAILGTMFYAIWKWSGTPYDWGKKES